MHAGVGAGGAFVEIDLEKQLNVVDVNCRSTVHLAYLVLRDMVARNRGRVLFTSSIASTMPGSFQALYNASKSFDQSLALGAPQRAQGHGGDDHLADAGPTDTEFFERADMLDTKIGAGDKDDPEDVARSGSRR